MTDYNLLNKELKAIIEGVDYFISNLSNASALIYSNMKDINWAGFYLYENDSLVLGPFQGKVACTKIEMGKGVCGTSAKNRKSIIVNNVHTFQGHIACDSASNSEIVIPLIKNNDLIGVLDIDSPIFNRFDEFDKNGLEEFVKIILNN